MFLKMTPTESSIRTADALVIRTYIEVNEGPVVCEIPKCLLARCPMRRCTKARYGWHCCTRQQPDLPVLDFFINANSDVRGSLAKFSKNFERPAVAWFFLSVGRPVWRLQYKFPGVQDPFEVDALIMLQGPLGRESVWLAK